MQTGFPRNDILEVIGRTCLILVLGFLGALLTALPVMGLLWIFLSYDHMQAYGVVLPLIIGITLAIVPSIFQNGSLIRLHKPVFAAYGCIMAVLLGYLFLTTSVPEKGGEHLPEYTREEMEAFRLKRECAAYRERYRTAAMAAFEGRSTRDDDFVIPIHCR